MFQYLLPAIIGMLIIGYIYGKPYWIEYRRDKVRAKPFPQAWRKIIRQRIPYFQHMPADLQLQLKKLIMVFIDEKNFIGARGLEISDDIRVTIAAQACLLLLNRKTDFYPKLRTIVVYPSAFAKVDKRTDEAGLHSESMSVMLGESWSYGRIVLSWQHAKLGAEIPDDGHNVVIHEFAHQLDSESGNANGAPILGKNSNYESWAKVFEQEYQSLRHQAAIGTHGLFDNYGATNPAEFFAVATEVFFEQSLPLFKHHLPLYQQLKAYYGVDPVNWH